MATKTIMWGDGTSDKITVTYSGSVGSGDMIVMSDPNPTLSSRHATIKLKINGGTIGTLLVDQKAGSRSFSVAYCKAYK